MESGGNDEKHKASEVELVETESSITRPLEVPPFLGRQGEAKQVI